MTTARSTEPKISVLCVDDSALVRSLMTEIINSQPDMHVCATAPDPLVARELIKQHNPDVLTLDVEMPRMDGLDFLEKLMRLRPMPVVMVSSLTERGSEITLRALELGAVDLSIPKSSPIKSAQPHAHGCGRRLTSCTRRPALAARRPLPPLRNPRRT
jgi:two-component system chemotaxis response regulator CheB